MQPKVLGVLRAREAKQNDGDVLADGMWARFLMVVPEPVPYGTLRNLPKRQRIDLAPIIDTTIVKGLDQLLPVQFDDDGEIQPHRVEWQREAAELMHAQHEAWDETAQQLGECEQGEWVGKLRGYSVRFALILHCLTLAMQSVGQVERVPPISVDTARRALTLALWFQAQYQGAQPLIGANVEGLPKPIAKLLAKAKARPRKDRQAMVDTRLAARWRVAADGTQNTDETISTLLLAEQAGLGATVKDRAGKVIGWQPPAL
jgi:hypothetical protein